MAKQAALKKTLPQAFRDDIISGGIGSKGKSKRKQVKAQLVI